MMSVPSFKSTGLKNTNSAKLPKEVFEVEIKNFQLIKESYVAHQANGRTNLAKTLKRGEVSGGGKKPWRQKGTGRARTGSIRNPIWRGGGIIFGPSGNENYTKKINSKARIEALKQSLSHANYEKKILVIESLTVKDGKTKTAYNLLKKIGIDNKALLVVDDIDNLTKMSFSNIPDVYIINQRVLSPFEVMNSRQILFTEGSLKSLKERLTGVK